MPKPSVPITQPALRITRLPIVHALVNDDIRKELAVIADGHVVADEYAGVHDSAIANFRPLADADIRVRSGSPAPSEAVADTRAAGSIPTAGAEPAGRRASMLAIASSASSTASTTGEADAPSPLPRCFVSAGSFTDRAMITAAARTGELVEIFVRGEKRNIIRPCIASVAIPSICPRTIAADRHFQQRGDIRNSGHSKFAFALAIRQRIRANMLKNAAGLLPLFVLRVRRSETRQR